MSEAIRVKQLVRDYVDGERTLHVLRGVDLKASAGEIVSVTGTSGSGKSTLLHLLGGLDRPTSGTVWLAGQELSKLSEGELARVRAGKIGIVFQFYHLLPEFTALENVMVPKMIGGESPGAAAEGARYWLDKVGLADRAGHKPGELSGGEQQRVAVARALGGNPDVVLADEPTGNLDDATGEEVHGLIRSLSRDEGKTFVVVTHKRGFATHADRVLTLVDKRLRQLD